MLHRLILHCGLEGAEERGYFGVGGEDLEDGLVVLVEEGEDVGHVGVFPEPVGWFHLTGHLSVGKHTPGQLPAPSVALHNILRIELTPG